MKPVAFDYQRALSLDSALDLIASSGDKTRLLSGGQSLGPMMNLRLARPECLVDVAKVAALREIEQRDGSVFVGAAITHAEIEDGLVPDPAGGGMREVAAGIAYRVVRNKGTIGGSVAHADPGADWPNFLSAAGAQVHLASPAGVRRVPMPDFMLAAYTTVLEPNELIQCIEIPLGTTQVRFGYHKLCRKVGEFSDATGTALIDSGRAYCRVVLGAVCSRPTLLVSAAAKLAASAAAPSLASVEEEIEALVSIGDRARLRMAAVAVGRAIEQALAR